MLRIRKKCGTWDRRLSASALFFDFQVTDMLGTVVSLVSLVPQLLSGFQRNSYVLAGIEDRAKIEESAFHAEPTITRYPSRGLALVLI